eukprot:10021388-Prorocentrum_lima.AAC.1
MTRSSIAITGPLQQTGAPGGTLEPIEIEVRDDEDTWTQHDLGHSCQLLRSQNESVVRKTRPRLRTPRTK